jgi:hypothetical protein
MCRLFRKPAEAWPERSPKARQIAPLIGSAYLAVRRRRVDSWHARAHVKRSARPSRRRLRRDEELQRSRPRASRTRAGSRCSQRRRGNARCSAHGTRNDAEANAPRLTPPAWLWPLRIPVLLGTSRCGTSFLFEPRSAHSEGLASLPRSNPQQEQPRCC